MTNVPYKRPRIRRLQPYQYQPYESGTLESNHATHTLQNQTGTLLNPKVLGMAQETAAKLRRAKAEFFRQLADAPEPDLKSFRDSFNANKFDHTDNFDHLMEIVLCKIAIADAPLNEKETTVINLLLGEERTTAYFNSLIKQSDHIDVEATLGSVIDIAMQLAAREQGNYNQHTDSLLGCLESLGQVILGADDEVNDRELEYFSKITRIVHSKVAKIDSRVQALVNATQAPECKRSPSSEKEWSSDSQGASSSKITQCIAQLHALVGMDSVKKEVETLINLAKIFSVRKQRGLPVPDVSFHMVFSGNPGTGKTSVARIIAQVYGCLGLLKRGQLVEVDRSGLVGNFVGQTATKTKNVIESAKGGVLFIDEAYALAKGSDNDFGHEAIETLLKTMEDCRGELVVIAAGYENKMAAFLESNPGLRSRFPRVISFPDYSADELFEIFCRIADQNRYVISDDGRRILQTEMDHLRQKRGPDFANAREVRNLFERVISMQADRVGSLKVVSDAELTTITEADVNLAVSSTRAPTSLPALAS
jgi:ATPase family associated with various cellular activities (AAA)/AAA lid domain